ncbi:MAG: phosphatidylserine decarboxylase family protein [Deltaproteobacteria bacterium]|nr:phosphatidylserine decarboxylase family protein [Deltaproteobacteria bacterium]
MDNSRVNNEWPVAKEGLPFIILGCAVTAVFIYLHWSFFSVLTGIITLFTVFFFRDPSRNNEADENAVLAPADGAILEVVDISDDNPLEEPAKKISIFMSVFNVHVNRVPISGTIKNIVYNPGRFFSANLDKASHYNENNRVIMETSGLKKIVVIQIAGLIARRIACWIKEGDHVKTGQRFGLIRFGSRLEVYIPGNSQINVKPGQKVRAGVTIIGYLQ